MDGTVYKSIQDRCSLEFINGGYLLQVRSSGGLFRDNIIHRTLRMALLGAHSNVHVLYGASHLVPVFIANGLYSIRTGSVVHSNAGVSLATIRVSFQLILVLVALSI